jgi:hypothetical protein
MKSIVLFAITIVLSFAGCEREATKYPYASVAELTAPHDNAEWEHVETLGNTVGPFRELGDQQLNTGAKPKRVRYVQGGSPVEKDLEFQEEVLLRRYENPQGDSLVVVYKRRLK